MEKHRMQIEKLREKFTQLHQKLNLLNGNRTGWTGEAGESFSAREAKLYEEASGILDEMEAAARHGRETV